MSDTESLEAIRYQIPHWLQPGGKYAAASFRTGADRPWMSAADVLERLDVLTDDELRVIADDILEAEGV
jgi:hypothetical protein